MTVPSQSERQFVEFDYGGCLLTDLGSVEDIDALIGGSATYYGKPGTIEAMWLVDGTVPWPGSPWPRPVYRVRWVAEVPIEQGGPVTEYPSQGTGEILPPVLKREHIDWRNRS